MNPAWETLHMKVFSNGGTPHNEATRNMAKTASICPDLD